MCVARNPSTPVDVLRQLAAVKNRDVRLCVAGNPSTPADVLMQLAADKNSDISRHAEISLLAMI
jgi:hypothetical protein